MWPYRCTFISYIVTSIIITLSSFRLWYVPQIVCSCKQLKIIQNFSFLGRRHFYGLRIAVTNRLFKFTHISWVGTSTGLFKMIVGVLTTFHIQNTWDRNVCIFLFDRTTLQVFVTYLTGALSVHPLCFYKHQHENRVRPKLFVACQCFAVCRQLSKLRSKRRNA